MLKSPWSLQLELEQVPQAQVPPVLALRAPGQAEVQARVRGQRALAAAKVRGQLALAAAEALVVVEALGPPAQVAVGALGPQAQALAEVPDQLVLVQAEARARGCRCNRNVACRTFLFLALRRSRRIQSCKCIRTQQRRFPFRGQCRQDRNS